MKRRYNGRKLKRVAILGTGKGYTLAPQSGEVWAVNDMGVHIYCSMLWDMHNFDWSFEECLENYAHLRHSCNDAELRKRVMRRKARWDSIKNYCIETGKPLMSVKHYSDIPSSIEFPIDDIINRFRNDFLTSAVSYMLSYAIYKHYTHIDLYGCNLEMGSEWAYQRDCFSYWIGYARGSGINVTISGSKFRPLRISEEAGGKLYSYDRIQKENGIRRTDIVNFRGKQLIMSTWDEGPQHKDSPPIKEVDIPVVISGTDLDSVIMQWESANM